MVKKGKELSSSTDETGENSCQRHYGTTDDNWTWTSDEIKVLL
jgi:hypothetical protein